MTLTITMTNNSSTPHEHGHPDYQRYEMLASHSSTMVWRAYYGAAAAQEPVYDTLGPGHTESGIQTWAGDTCGDDKRRLPPGIYTVSAYWLVGNAWETNNVEITIE